MIETLDCPVYLEIPDCLENPDTLESHLEHPAAQSIPVLLVYHLFRLYLRCLDFLGFLAFLEILVDLEHHQMDLDTLDILVSLELLFQGVQEYHCYLEILEDLGVQVSLPLFLL
jgi:hypothetical protein